MRRLRPRREAPARPAGSGAQPAAGGSAAAAGFLPPLRRWWWLLLAATAVGALAAYIATLAIQPTYTATTRLLTGPVSADLETLTASGDLARTYAEVATSELVLDPVAGRLGLDLPRTELAERVRATGNDVTRILSVDADAPSADEAADLANAIAAELRRISLAPSAESALIEDVLGQREIAGLGEDDIQLVREALDSALEIRPTGRLTVIEPAAVPTGPSAPQTPLLLLLGAAAGLVAAAIFALVHARRRAGVNIDSLRRAVGDEHLVGRIPAAPRGRGEQAAVLDRPDSREADAFRIVAERIRPEVGDRSLLVSSASMEVSSSVAANVALALADSGVEVVVVDTGSDGPVARALGSEPALPATPRARGSRASRNGRSVSRPVADQRRLGLVSTVSSEPLSPRAARPLLHELAEGGVLRIIAGPSVVRSANGLAWAREVDAVLLVAGDDESSSDIWEAVSTVAQAGARLAGVVVVDEARA
jgi:Mrp family chromosome partitioning ATPase